MALPTGRFLVFWEDSRPRSTPLLTSIGSSDGRTWSTPRLLTPASGTVVGSETAALPDAVVDGKGNVTVVWLRQLASSFQLQAAVYRGAANSWTSPVDVGDCGCQRGSESAANFAIAENANGEVFARWQELIDKGSSSYFVTHAALELAPGRWTRLPPLNETTTRPAVAPDGAFLLGLEDQKTFANGGFVPVGEKIIRAAGDGKSWEDDADFAPAQGALLSAGSIQLASGPGGEVEASWAQTKPTAFVLAFRDAGGNWSTPAPLSALNGGINGGGALTFISSDRLLGLMEGNTNPNNIYSVSLHALLIQISAARLQSTSTLSRAMFGHTELVQPGSTTVFWKDVNLKNVAETTTAVRSATWVAGQTAPRLGTICRCKLFPGRAAAGGGTEVLTDGGYIAYRDGSDAAWKLYAGPAAH